MLPVQGWQHLSNRRESLNFSMTGSVSVRNRPPHSRAFLASCLPPFVWRYVPNGTAERCAALNDWKCGGITHMILLHEQRRYSAGARTIPPGYAERSRSKAVYLLDRHDSEVRRSSLVFGGADGEVDRTGPTRPGTPPFKRPRVPTSRHLHHVAPFCQQTRSVA